MLKQYFSIFILFILAISLSAFLLATGPKPEISDDVKTVLSVSAIHVKPSDFTTTYDAFGTVEALNKRMITAYVDGQLTYINSNLLEGGNIKKGELIYKVDDSDIRNRLKLVESELAIAKASLKLELGEQKYAKKNFKANEPNLSLKELKLHSALRLREPQLEQAKAKVIIAESNVNLEKLTLKRSQFYSDNDYLVLSKNIHLGGYVSTGDKLAELVQLDKVRISIPLPIHIAKKLSVGQSVVVIGQRQQNKTAVISEISPNLSSKSQLQQVYLTLENTDHSFILGEFVKSTISLQKYQNTIKVPVKSLDNDTVFVVNNSNRLIQRTPKILWRGEDYVITENFLLAEELVVTSKFSHAEDDQVVNVISGVL